MTNILTDILNQHQDVIFKYARRTYNKIHRYSQASYMEVEDIAQEIWINITNHVGKYKPEIPLQAWVAQISKSSTVDLERFFTAQKRTPCEIPKEDGKSPQSPEEILILHESQRGKLK